VRDKNSIKIKKWIFQTVFYIGLFFPSIGIGQSLIKGNVYFFDSGEPVICCHVLILDNIKIDSVMPRYLNGIKIDDIDDFEENFEVKVTSNDTIDLLINFLGYRNTIVKNIPNNADTIDLSWIPLVY
jgi:hypothetical protein